MVESAKTVATPVLSATFTPAADEETVFSLRRCRPDSSFSLRRQPVCSSAAGRAVVHWAANRCSPRSTWEVFITLCADPEPLPREQASAPFPASTICSEEDKSRIRSHIRSGSTPTSTQEKCRPGIHTFVASSTKLHRTATATPVQPQPSAASKPSTANRNT